MCARFELGPIRLVLLVVELREMRGSSFSFYLTVLLTRERERGREKEEEETLFSSSCRVFWRRLGAWSIVFFVEWLNPSETGLLLRRRRRRRLLAKAKVD
jgi:hypothetical protein